ncbi:MAG: GNAT family N-acetyltransferase [Caulobacteraceae bacterium]
MVKRDSLEDVDVGFAFLQRFRGQGYAFEAAAASLAHAREDLGLARVVAITAPDNEASIGWWRSSACASTAWWSWPA